MDASQRLDKPWLEHVVARPLERNLLKEPRRRHSRFLDSRNINMRKESGKDAVVAVRRFDVGLQRAWSSRSEPDQPSSFKCAFGEAVWLPDRISYGGSWSRESGE